VANGAADRCVKTISSTGKLKRARSSSFGKTVFAGTGTVPTTHSARKSGKFLFR